MFKDLLLLPLRVAKLVGALAVDSRVPRHMRVSLAVSVLYLASPLDLIPDWLPVIGHIDDAVVAVLILDAIFARVPMDVVQSHWSGTRSQLEWLSTISRTLALPIPGRVKRRLFAA